MEFNFVVCCKVKGGFVYKAVREYGVIGIDLFGRKVW